MKDDKIFFLNKLLLKISSQVAVESFAKKEWENCPSFLVGKSFKAQYQC